MVYYIKYYLFYCYKNRNIKSKQNYPMTNSLQETKFN